MCISSNPATTCQTQAAKDNAENNKLQIVYKNNTAPNPTFNKTKKINKPKRNCETEMHDRNKKKSKEKDKPKEDIVKRRERNRAESNRRYMWKKFNKKPKEDLTQDVKSKAKCMNSFNTDQELDELVKGINIKPVDKPRKCAPNKEKRAHMTAESAKPIKSEKKRSTHQTAVLDRRKDESCQTDKTIKLRAKSCQTQGPYKCCKHNTTIIDQNVSSQSETNTHRLKQAKTMRPSMCPKCKKQIGPDILDRNGEYRRTFEGSMNSIHPKKEMHETEKKQPRICSCPCKRERCSRNDRIITANVSNDQMKNFCPCDNKEFIQARRHTTRNYVVKGYKTGDNGSENTKNRGVEIVINGQRKEIEYHGSHFRTRGSNKTISIESFKSNKEFNECTNCGKIHSFRNLRQKMFNTRESNSLVGCVTVDTSRKYENRNKTLGRDKKDMSKIPESSNQSIDHREDILKTMMGRNENNVFFGVTCDIREKIKEFKGFLQHYMNIFVENIETLDRLDARKEFEEIEVMNIKHSEQIQESLDDDRMERILKDMQEKYSVLMNKTLDTPSQLNKVDVLNAKECIKEGADGEKDVTKDQYIFENIGGARKKEPSVDQNKSDKTEETSIRRASVSDVKDLKETQELETWYSSDETCRPLSSETVIEAKIQSRKNKGEKKLKSKGKEVNKKKLKVKKRQVRGYQNKLVRPKTKANKTETNMKKSVIKFDRKFFELSDDSVRENTSTKNLPRRKFCDPLRRSKSEVLWVQWNTNNRVTANYHNIVEANKSIFRINQVTMRRQAQTVNPKPSRTIHKCTKSFNIRSSESVFEAGNYLQLKADMIHEMHKRKRQTLDMIGKTIDNLFKMIGGATHETNTPAFENSDSDNAILKHIMQARRAEANNTRNDAYTNRTNDKEIYAILPQVGNFHNNTSLKRNHKMNKSYNSHSKTFKIIKRNGQIQTSKEASTQSEGIAQGGTINTQTREDIKTKYVTLDKQCQVGQDEIKPRMNTHLDSVKLETNTLTANIADKTTEHPKQQNAHITDITSNKPQLQNVNINDTPTLEPETHHVALTSDKEITETKVPNVKQILAAFNVTNKPLRKPMTRNLKNRQHGSLLAEVESLKSKRIVQSMKEKYEISGNRLRLVNHKLDNQKIKMIK